MPPFVDAIFQGVWDSNRERSQLPSITLTYIRKLEAARGAFDQRDRLYYEREAQTLWRDMSEFARRTAVEYIAQKDPSAKILTGNFPAANEPETT